MPYDDEMAHLAKKRSRQIAFEVDSIDRQILEKSRRINRVKPRPPPNGGLTEVCYTHMCELRKCSFIFDNPYRDPNKLMLEVAPSLALSATSTTTFKSLSIPPTMYHDVEKVDEHEDVDSSIAVTPPHPDYSNFINFRTIVKDDPHIDPELNKYPPLVEYGLDIVSKTITLVIDGAERAASFIADVPENIKSSIKSVTVQT
jgi:hypothetical protein